MGFIQRKKVLRLAKGFRGRAKNCIKIARNRVEKALQHNYRHRKLRARDQRRLWILQTNAAARLHGLAYSQLLGGMAKEQVQINRKMLAELAQTEPLSFEAVLDQVATAQGATRRVAAPAGWVASVSVPTDGGDPFLKPRRVRKNLSALEKVVKGMTESRAGHRRAAAHAAAAAASAELAGQGAEGPAEVAHEHARQ